MTLEELSSANARRNAMRMSGDLQNSSKVSHPPRMQPPQSSRGAMHDEMEHLDAENAGADPAPVSAQAADVVQGDDQAVRDAVETLLGKGDVFFLHTTEEQRTRLRALMVPPGTHTRALYTNPVHAAIVVGVVSAAIGYVVADQQHRPSMSHASDACRRACERTLRFV